GGGARGLREPAPAPGSCGPAGALARGRRGRALLRARRRRAAPRGAPRGGSPPIEDRPARRRAGIFQRGMATAASAGHAQAILSSSDPATGELLGTVPATAPERVADVVADVAKVQPLWALLRVKDR